MNDNNWLSGGSGDVAYPTSILSSSASSTNDSSILRTSKSKQTQSNNPIDDLFIFGYACKIFRDDDKARYIDQGKHLIPWMGDNSLKIDRLIHIVFFFKFFFLKKIRLFVLLLC